MQIKPKIVVITGAESTGKSTLTEQLAKYFGVPFIPEIARSYIENLNRNYSFSDVEQIARLQVAEFKNHKDLHYPYIFIDTWLIITKVWFEFVYNKTPDWIIEEIKKTEIDLFLVCDIDLPWVYDPVRENGGETRKILHDLYIKNIEDFNFSYRVINGENEMRFISALKSIEELK